MDCSNTVLGTLTPAEKERIAQFQVQMKAYEQHLWSLYCEFVQQVEREYRQLYVEIDKTFDDGKNSVYRAEHSVKLAKLSGVADERIIKNRNQLDDLFCNERDQ